MDKPTGSISSGTMREEDLIPCFLDVLIVFDPDRAKTIKEDVDKLILIEHPGYGTYYDDTDDIDGISSRHLAGFILNEDLFDALNDVAPEGYYFGSHPGDGADYGFWECEDID